MAFRPKKIQKPYDFKRSYNYVLWLLGRKSYTKAQLREKLFKKEAQESDIDKVIAKLESLKFVDDEVYAENYIRSRKARKGSLALKQELRRKGVSEELLEKTLEPLDLDSQLSAALSVLEKSKWRILKADKEKRYSKAFAFLARRGFPADVVKEAIAQTDFE